MSYDFRLIARENARYFPSIAQSTDIPLNTKANEFADSVFVWQWSFLVCSTFAFMLLFVISSFEEEKIVL